ncbi:MAG: class I SAM-dependent methyltransferase [Chloroflexi bacterium]|nr:class I SAM-dependent methyltransferase [Chloroflexota bacterium]MBU1746554.1 class I SAM-dependent methyltransferase [Chloroflexota bacterium]
MSSHPEHSSEDRILFIERQYVTLDPLGGPGHVLDLGGGGEGVIGQLMGERVVAIDPILRELAEAPAGPLKIVMDARNLQFLDATFDTVTAFFTFLYLEPADREIVLREAYRVLQPGGQFLIWDVSIPPRGAAVQDIFAVRLTITLPDRQVSTGYGAPWTGREQDRAVYVQLAEQAGFQVMAQGQQDQVFHLRLIKPLSQE